MSRLLRELCPRAASLGQGGQRGRHLLEVDESLVGAESHCQGGDSGAADGIALETDTKRGALGRATLGTTRWAVGLCWGLKAPVTPRTQQLPAAGSRGQRSKRGGSSEHPARGSVAAGWEAARGCHVSGTYSRLCRL